MANILSIFSRINAIPRVWRLVVLLTLSQLVLTTVVRERVLDFLRSRRNFGQKKASLINSAGRPKHWFAAIFLGHFADLEPWKKASNFLVRILDKRFEWYQSVKNGPDPHSVRVKLVTDDFIFSQDLALISAIKGKEDRLFRNSDTIRRAWGAMFPDSVTVRTGEKWKRVRRVIVAAMAKLDFDYLPPSTNEVLEEGMNKYVVNEEQEIKLYDCFAKITFDSFHKFVFNINFRTIAGENLNVLDDMVTLANKVSDRLLVTLPFLWTLPTKTNRKIWACHKRILKFVDDYIDNRNEDFKAGRVNQTKFTNFLDAMIKAWHEDTLAQETGIERKRSLTRPEIRSQLCAAMFGGFDTTSSSMSFITMNLSLYPEFQQKLYEEVKDVDLSAAKGSELEALPYLNSFINESLRLNAVAPGVIRIPNEDVVVNGRYIKKGTNILVDHEALGKRPDVWGGMQDLDKFRPERWIETTPKENSFFPFGFGGRMCPGHKVAKSQMRVITAFICKNYFIKPSAKPVRVMSSLGRSVTRDSTVTFAKRKVSA